MTYTTSTAVIQQSLFSGLLRTLSVGISTLYSFLPLFPEIMNEAPALLPKYQNRILVLRFQTDTSHISPQQKPLYVTVDFETAPRVRHPQQVFLITPCCISTINCEQNLDLIHSLHPAVGF